MTQTDRFTGGTVPRYLAILVAAVLGLSLMPAAALADHQPDNIDPCEGAPVANEYVDRNEARATHRPSIDCVIYRSIAVGSSNEQGQQVYNPLNPVRRDQMASFISQTLDAAGYEEDLSEGTDDAFTDISGNVHRRNINRLADAGIVRGTGGGRYSPAERISRQQMASFIVQAARWAVGDEHPIERDAADQFVDVSNNNVHKDNIEAGADAEPPLFRGETPTTFAPGKNVLRDQMATFLVNLLRYVFDEARAPQVVNVTIADQAVAPGEPITGTISGANSATVSGACVTDGDVADTDANEEGIQFSIRTNRDATPGDCELTFRLQTDDGEVVRTRTITIQAAAGGVTVRPELVGAQIIDTVTTQQGTPARPAGTYVRYTFDEEIVCQGPNAPNGANFKVYRFNNSFVTGSTTTAGGSTGTLAPTCEGRTVDVHFQPFNTAELAQELSLATVLVGAVRDPQGNTNPEGDRPIGQGGQTQLQPGVTVGPDLQSVTIRGQGGDANSVAVDFTFDQNAFVQRETGGFFLVMTGLHDAGPNDAPHKIYCRAEDDPNAAGGQAAPGGSGTQTVTVNCENPQTNLLQRTTLTNENVARGGVETGTVSRTAAGQDANPLQTADVGSTNTTTNGPDLVSATLQPGDPNASGDARFDRVLYTFDQEIQTANAPGFRIYNRDTSEVFGQSAQINQQNRNQVLVVFGTLAAPTPGRNAVGASVDDFAVAGTNGIRNRSDEEGMQNDRQDTRTAGQTSGPQLTGVTLDQGTDAFGQPDRWRATYTFDEPVTAAGTNQNVATSTAEANRFNLYLGSGQRLQATNCEFVGATATQGATQVRCTNYTQVGGADSGTAATQAQIQSAVLGTVEFNAVQERAPSNDSAQPSNPEGAENTSGGSGTPQQ